MENRSRFYSSTCKSCGIILSESVQVKTKKRYICKYCHAKQNRDYWHRTKEPKLEKRRNSREVKWKTYICTICGKDFVSYMPTVKVCSHECKVVRKRFLRRVAKRLKNAK